jgi:hydroxylamine dehydrogenase
MLNTHRTGTALLIIAALILAAPLVFIRPGRAEAQDGSVCVECHTQVTPGIVDQWEMGKMGGKVDCSICHGSDHKGATDAAKALIPTPGTCRLCHPKQVDGYRDGKHALAWTAMKALPMLDQQPGPIVGTQGFKGCSGCHKIGEKSPEDLRSDAFRYGTGACDSCHTRHTFSKAEAQNPRACQTCHMGFDHAQWEMWSTSKHGTIWQIEGNSDRAPTCQKCHMPDGEHGVLTPWGFLAVRVPEDDQEWWNDRVEILKALGVLDDQGQETARMAAFKAVKVARFSKEEFDTLRREYQTACTKCHSASFVSEQMAANDGIIREADKVMAEAIRIVRGLYDEGLLKKPEGWKVAPDLLQFYEAQSSIEQELYTMFMEYRMRAFQGAFHNNPDYLHWYGWAAMKEALQRIEDDAASIRSDAADKAAQGQGVDPKAEVEKSVQAATSAQAADLKAVQEAQQAAGQQIVEIRGQMQQVSDGLNEVAGDTAALKSEVAAAAESNALPWIAGGLALIALALGIIALVRRRA